jgi:uncharacterized membrane protein
MLQFFQRNKLLSVILVISLGLNAFLMAHVIGHKMRQRMMIGRLTQAQITRLVEYAPEQKRDRLKTTLEKNVKDIEKDLESIRTERQNLSNLLMAEKFNEDAVQRQFAILRVRMNYLQKHLQLLTMNMLRELSPEERAKAVQMMQPKKLWRPHTTQKPVTEEEGKALEKKDGKKVG